MTLLQVNLHMYLLLGACYIQDTLLSVTNSTLNKDTSFVSLRGTT